MRKTLLETWKYTRFILSLPALVIHELSHLLSYIIFCPFIVGVTLDKLSLSIKKREAICWFLLTTRVDIFHSIIGIICTIAPLITYISIMCVCIYHIGILGIYFGNTKELPYVLVSLYCIWNHEWMVPSPTDYKSLENYKQDIRNIIKIKKRKRKLNNYDSRRNSRA